jgi:hypothetical protein
VRTVAPFPASVRAEDVPVERLAKTYDGRMVPVSLGGTATRIYALNSCRQTMGMSPDGRTLFVLGSGYRVPRIMLRLGTDGKGDRAKGSVMLHDECYSETQTGGILGWGTLHMAASRNGEWLYFGSSEARGQHCVYRKKVADVGNGPKAKNYEYLTACAPEVYLGEPGKPDNDNAHFNSPRGVACDDAGNLYVADHGNDRIQVFDAAGKYARTIPFEAADQLQVHPKTGDIYALGWGKGGHRLAKLDKDGKLVAQMPLNPIQYSDASHPTVFCLDWAAAEPSVWVVNGTVSGRSRRGVLQRYVARGGKFELAVDVYKLAMDAAKDWPPVPGLGQTQPKIMADPNREEIYFEGKRADGRTGKILPGPLLGSELHVGPDGLVYYRREIQAGTGYVSRFDPADPNAKDIPFGDKKNLPYDYLGGCRSFQDGFCVAPNGDVYLNLHEADSGLFVPKLRAIGQGDRLEAKPKSFTNSNLIFLHVWGPDGTPKQINAFPGLFRCNGVRMARNGNFYASVMAMPKGSKGPDGGGDGDWGTLVVVDSSFDKFPVGRMRGNADEERFKGEATHFGCPGGNWLDMRIEPLRWQYAGVSPSRSSGSCSCHNSRFDLDRFDRAWVPAMQTYTVNVLDANGNLVVRVGGYGNADSRGKDSPVADPKTGLLRPKRPTDPADLVPPKELSERPGFRMVPFVAVTDEALYAVDKGNNRVVRCVLGYHAEETVPAPSN